MQHGLSTEDIPQANDLQKVILTVIAVSKGKSSDIEIAKFIKFTDRQARYYRKAAALLGFVDNKRNNTILTPKGSDLIVALGGNYSNLEILKPYIVEIPIVRELLERFEASGSISPKEFLKALREVSDLKDPSTSKRRISTIINWLNQTGLLTKSESKKEKGKFFLIPYVPIRSTPAPSFASLYDRFVRTILPYIPEGNAVDGGAGTYDEDIALIQNFTAKELALAVRDIPSVAKTARLILAVSEKTPIDSEKLFNELQEFKRQSPSPERVLIERYRSQKRAASQISSGGSALESLIEAWFRDNNIDISRSHLFDGLSKNCDFYAEDIAVVIESKFSKTSGTKHSGAIKDIQEIAKAKKSKPNLLIGISVAGSGISTDVRLWEQLTKLHKSKQLDFIVTPSTIKSMTPRQLKRVNSLEVPTEESLKLETHSESTWGTPETLDELGLSDACRWFGKYSSVLFFNFESLLNAWISQTLYAVPCLRLMLNWSESKMDSFIQVSVPHAARTWKNSTLGFESVSLLVMALSSNLSDEEKRVVKNYISNSFSMSDLLEAREMNMGGLARRKKEISETFINICKEKSPFDVINEQTSETLPDLTELKSSFSIRGPNSEVIKVICKYYSTSGSVMSDLVKSVRSLGSTKSKDQWIILADGPGWTKRDKDLRRLLDASVELDVAVYNLSMWQDQSKHLKRHIP